MPNKRFYVYTLADPQNKVFYVGKGQGDRIFHHELEAKRNCQCHKCRKIRKIWRNDGQVQKHYVFETNQEQEAYDYEAQLITEIGLKNLCNKTVGGPGARSVTEEEYARRREAMAEYAAEMALKKAQVAEALKEKRQNIEERKRRDRENNGLPPGHVLVSYSRSYRKK